MCLPRRRKSTHRLNKINIMGKSVGLIGDVSGKVGNVVFYTRNGVQVARVYVKHPNNPKSTAQTGQRMKMALAGRLSSIVPYAAIEGLGGGKSERRSRFMSNLLLKSSVNGNVAGVNESDVVFSEGALGSVMQHGVVAISQTAGSLRRGVSISTSMSGSTPDVPDGYGERFVVLFLNVDTSEYDYAVTGLLTMPTGSEAALTNVNVRVGDIVSTYRAIVYVCPFMMDPDSNNGRFRVSYIGTDDGTIVVNLETGEEVGVQLLYGRSLRVQSVILNPPAMNGSN